VCLLEEVLGELRVVGDAARADVEVRVEGALGRVHGDALDGRRPLDL
jgi:hypothetical protein